MKTEVNEEYSAVFVNNKEDSPSRKIPLGIYAFSHDTVVELCEYFYILDGLIEYKILKWERREPLDSPAKLAIKTILDQQLAISHLVKE